MGPHVAINTGVVGGGCEMGAANHLPLLCAITIMRRWSTIAIILLGTATHPSCLSII